MRHLKHAADSFQRTSDIFCKQIATFLVWDVMIKGGSKHFWNGIPLLNFEGGFLKLRECAKGVKFHTGSVLENCLFEKVLALFSALSIKFERKKSYPR